MVEMTQPSGSVKIHHQHNDTHSAFTDKAGPANQTHHIGKDHMGKGNGTHHGHKNGANSTTDLASDATSEESSTTSPSSSSAAGKLGVTGSAVFGLAVIPGVAFF